MKEYLYLLLVICCLGCTVNDKKGKYQSTRDNVIGVHELVKELPLGELLIGPISRPYICGDYLVIADYRSTDKVVHLLDKNTFAHITSFGQFGPGPSEITRIGGLAWDGDRRNMYITDHGKWSIVSYNLDSVLADSSYVPQVKFKMDKGLFPSNYQYINDTLSFGVFIKPSGPSTFKQIAGKWNIETGEIYPLVYDHPDVKVKRIFLAVSMENSTYVECNNRYDLMSIFNLSGTLKYNIYGPNWDSSGDGKSHFGGVIFYKDWIIAAYEGEDFKSYGWPTKFHVFTLDGDYIKTLDIGYRISRFCCDEFNDRLIFCFDDEIQYGYLDLKGIL